MFFINGRLIFAEMILEGLYISDTAEKGRGVFTEEPIAADKVVEESPVIVMSAADRAHLDKTLLHDYIFEWQPEGQNLCCMALGWIPIYNHSGTPNCEYFMDYDNQIIFVKTLRAITPGEELTFNYDGDNTGASVLWFEEKK